MILAFWWMLQSLDMCVCMPLCVFHAKRSRSPHRNTHCAFWLVTLSDSDSSQLLSWCLCEALRGPAPAPWAPPVGLVFGSVIRAAAAPRPEAWGNRQLGDDWRRRLPPEKCVPQSISEESLVSLGAVSYWSISAADNGCEHSDLTSVLRNVSLIRNDPGHTTWWFP